MKLKLREQHVGTSSGPPGCVPCSSCLDLAWTCRFILSAGNPGKAETSLGLVFGEGGEELIFLWSFPRPILHFEMEQIPTVWLVLILVEKFASVSAF